MQNFVIHFDVPNGFVLLETFVGSAQGVERTINALNDEIFASSAQLELVVFPPHPGSLKQIIGIILKGTAISYAFLWTLIQAMDSQTVQDIFRELVGQTPSEALLERVQKLKDAITEQETDESSKGDPVSENEAKQLVEEFVCRTAKSALEMPRQQLVRCRIPDQLKYELSVAQSELYRAALDDQSVRGIGFDLDDIFPIPRNEFVSRAVPPIAPRDDAEDEWHVELAEVSVTSPNFDSADQRVRKWKGRLKSGSVVFFEINDEEFWHGLRSASFDFAGKTTLFVQMAKRIEQYRSKDRRVLRVLSINGEHLADPLDQNALSSILGQIRNSDGRWDQADSGDLFDSQ